MSPTDYLFTEGPLRVGQVGSHAQCGHVGCPVRKVAWRVILGSWDVQVYTCQRHLPWAIELDMLHETVTATMGWQRHRDGNGYICRTTRVVSCLGHIKRINYLRDPEVGATFPQTVRKRAEGDYAIGPAWR